LQVLIDLWEEMTRSVGPYPSGMVAVPKWMRGTAFFPGGLGIWIEAGQLAKLPFGKVMILGQDFDTETSYQRSFAVGTEVETSATWRNLRKILGEAGICLSDCFFTNVYMGLRTCTKPTRSCPGKRDREFVRQCEEFLLRQLAVMQPRLIVTLGAEPFEFLSRPKFGLRAGRRRLEVFLQRDVPMPHGPALVAELTQHPCMYGPCTG
jgi:hypothetical protein